MLYIPKYSRFKPLQDLQNGHVIVILSDSIRPLDKYVAAADGYCLT